MLDELQAAILDAEIAMICHEQELAELGDLLDEMNGGK